MNRLTLLLAACILCFSQAGRAADSGAYLGAGVALLPSVTACDTGATICHNTLDSDRAADLSLIAGYDFNKFIGIEGGWARLGSYKLKDTADTLIGTARTSAVTLAARGGYKFHFGLSLFAKLGLAQVWNQYTPGPAWVQTINTSQKSIGTLVAVGVQYDFNNAIGVRSMLESVSFNDPAFEGNLAAAHLMAIFKL